MEIVNKINKGNEFNDSTIVEGSNMDLRDFAAAHGPSMYVEPWVNKTTGEEFKTCAFYNKAGVRTFVAFSSKLGVLTAKEIAEKADQLQVIQMSSGRYRLCRKGDVAPRGEEVLL